MSDARYNRRIDRRRRFGNTVKGAWNALLPLVRGSGDYTIDGNSQQVPQFASGRTFRISHREYIQDVESSIGFVNSTFPLNPANAACFPWLSNIALNFQEYIVHGMVFQFVSTSADALNSTNTALGTVIMGTDYNAANLPYASKQAAENAEFTVSCRPSMSLRHAIECDPHQSPIGELYIRTGAQPSDTDIRLYDLGRFQIATQGMQAASVNIGELWVTYQVALFKPRLFSALGRLSDAQYIASSAVVALTQADPIGVGVATPNIPSNFTLVYNNLPLCPTSQLVPNGSYCPFQDTPTNSRFRFVPPIYPQPVCYDCEVIWKWSSAQIMSATAPVFAPNDSNNIVSLEYYGDSTGWLFTPDVGVSGTVWTCRFTIKCNFQDGDNYIDITYTNFPLVNASVYLRCIQLP